MRLVSLGADGAEHSTDVLRITRPGDLTGLASLGLTLADSKQLLAGLQREIVAAQARVHAFRRPECPGCGTACRMKDYRPHAIATLFGQVVVRLPRFRCAGCGTTDAGVTWPLHARSTPELDRQRAQLSALMTYRTAAEILGQMFPVDSGAAHETLRRHTFKVAERLSMPRQPNRPLHPRRSWSPWIRPSSGVARPASGTSRSGSAMSRRPRDAGRCSVRWRRPTRISPH